MSNRTFDLLLKQDFTGKTAQVHLSQKMNDVTQIRIKLPNPGDYTSSMTHTVTLNNLYEGTAVDWGVDNARSVAGADGTLSYNYDLSDDDLPTPTISIYGKIHSMGNATGQTFPDETTEILKLGDIDDAYSLFSYLYELTKVDDVEGFQRICDKSTSLKQCFSGCVSLTEIPSGLFDHCTAVTDFNECFNGCNALTAIPSGLFDNCTAVTDFSYCFYTCEKIAAIPAGLFDHCTAVTTFFRCFGSCYSLTAIPAGLFDQCNYVTSFNGCFFNCGNIKEIPEGLFDHCSIVTGFADCFSGCISITSIPPALFNNCTEVKRFNDCFFNCSKATGETPYTMVKGKKIRLWERTPEDGFAKVTYCSRCFYQCVNLSDYAEIPSDWK